jgi:hypothetical protein
MGNTLSNDSLSTETKEIDKFKTKKKKTIQEKLLYVIGLKKITFFDLKF